MKIILFILFFALFFGHYVNAQKSETLPTVVKDQSTKAKLIGLHRLSLQWISWNYFGKATVIEKNGMLILKGEQKSKKGNDYLKIDGIITAMESKSFTFRGTVTTKISYINGGQPCKREGEMTFAIKGARKYWRLQQMQSPCGDETDYVDIYFS